jgi:hypothetical protein
MAVGASFLESTRLCRTSSFSASAVSTNCPQVSSPKEGADRIMEGVEPVLDRRCMTSRRTLVLVGKGESVRAGGVFIPEDDKDELADAVAVVILPLLPLFLLSSHGPVRMLNQSLSTDCCILPESLLMLSLTLPLPVDPIELRLRRL